MASKSQWCHNSDAIHVFFNAIFRPTKDMEISRHELCYLQLYPLTQTFWDAPKRLQDGQISPHEYALSMLIKTAIKIKKCHTICKFHLI